MHEVLVNRLGGVNLPRKSVIRLTDHPDMTDFYRGCKTTTQQQQSSGFNDRGPVFAQNKTRISRNAVSRLPALFHKIEVNL